MPGAGTRQSLRLTPPLPWPKAKVRIESPELQEPREVVAGPDGRFEYRGRAPWELYGAGDAVESTVIVTASDNARTAPPKIIGGGPAQRRWFGVGSIRSSDVGVLVVADPVR